jgi:hypothetical protein
MAHVIGCSIERLGICDCVEHADKRIQEQNFDYIWKVAQTFCDSKEEFEQLIEHLQYKLKQMG